MATIHFLLLTLVAVCLGGEVGSQEILIDAPQTILSLPAQTIVQLFVQNDLDYDHCFFVQFSAFQQSCYSNVSIVIIDPQGENSSVISTFYSYQYKKFAGLFNGTYNISLFNNGTSACSLGIVAVSGPVFGASYNSNITLPADTSGFNFPTAIRWNSTDFNSTDIVNPFTIESATASFTFYMFSTLPSSAPLGSFFFSGNDAESCYSNDVCLVDTAANINYDGFFYGPVYLLVTVSSQLEEQTFLLTDQPPTDIAPNGPPVKLSPSSGENSYLRFAPQSSRTNLTFTLLSGQGSYSQGLTLSCYSTDNFDTLSFVWQLPVLNSNSPISTARMFPASLNTELRCAVLVYGSFTVLLGQDFTTSTTMAATTSTSFSTSSTLATSTSSTRQSTTLSTLSTTLSTITSTYSVSSSAALTSTSASSLSTSATLSTLATSASSIGSVLSSSTTTSRSVTPTPTPTHKKPKPWIWAIVGGGGVLLIIVVVVVFLVLRTSVSAHEYQPIH